jgi:hypothetical protein
LSGRGSSPSRSCAISLGQSSSASGPTYTLFTDAIGAMSQAPRHSNARMLKPASSPAASSIAS